MIRFLCRCGRKIAVRPELAGRKGRCPACQTILVVPKRPDPKAAPAAPPRIAATSTDADIFKAIVGGLGKAVAQDYMSRGGYYVKLKLSTGRSQGVTLSRGSDGSLVVTSEIGMITGPDHGLTALQLAERLPELRLHSDGLKVLHASLTVPLPWDQPRRLVEAVERLAAGADQIEQALFGIDLR